MNSLISLAKAAVENYIKKGEIISLPKDFPQKFLNNQAGVFVTISKIQDQRQNLRGCIGTYLPTRKNIAEETIYNAIASATKDYRFGPIQKEELPYLCYAVYILNKPELVKNFKELDPKKYGIIVKTTPIVSSKQTDVHFVPKSGLLLPGLKGIDTVGKQIYLACQKAGIDLEKEKILIYRFTATRQKE